jgi:hypothetical protein
LFDKLGLKPLQPARQANAPHEDGCKHVAA